MARSAPGADGAQAGQTGGCGLTFVVTDECVERREVDRGGEVNRVQGAQRGLLERAGRSEKRAIDRQQSDGIEDLSRSSHERLGRKRRIVGCRATDRAGHLGERELT